MQKLSFMAILAMSTMLTACGGGGGGSGHSFNTQIPTLNLPNGSVVEQSGTRIQTVNNKEERTARYETAVAQVTGKSKTSIPDIDTAYANMNKILVNNDFTTFTETDILLSLAMADPNQDIDGLKGKTLSELQTAAQSDALKSIAEDTFARYGTERDLSLKDIKLYEPNDANAEIYSFIINADGILTGLKMSDEAGSTNINFDIIGNGTYKSDKQLSNYGFKYIVPGTTRAFEEEFTFEGEKTPEQIRAAFIETAKKEWANEPELTELINWLQTADFNNMVDTEHVCEDSTTNCIYKEYLTDNVVVKYDSFAKDVGLKYSDFGKLDFDVSNGAEVDFSLFQGGYEQLSAKAKDLPNVAEAMTFTGKALAEVEYWNGVDEDHEEIALYSGSANLTFQNGKEKLVADFADWHKLQFETNDSGSYDFTFTGTPKNATFAMDPNGYTHSELDITYYGENPKNPDEAGGLGWFDHNKQVGDHYEWIGGKMVFGATCDK